MKVKNSKCFAIEWYVIANLNNNGDQCYALGYYYNKAASTLSTNVIQKVNLEHLIAVDKEVGGLVAIKADDIKRKCVFTSLDHCRYTYLCIQLNNVEYCA